MWADVAHCLPGFQPESSHPFVDANAMAGKGFGGVTWTAAGFSGRSGSGISSRSGAAWRRSWRRSRRTGSESPTGGLNRDGGSFDRRACCAAAADARRVKLWLERIGLKPLVKAALVCLQRGRSRKLQRFTRFANRPRLRRSRQQVVAGGAPAAAFAAQALAVD